MKRIKESQSNLDKLLSRLKTSGRKFYISNIDEIEKEIDGEIFTVVYIYPENVNDKTFIIYNQHGNIQYITVCDNIQDSMSYPVSKILNVEGKDEQFIYDFIMNESKSVKEKRKNKFTSRLSEDAESDVILFFKENPGMIGETTVNAHKAFLNWAKERNSKEYKYGIFNIIFKRLRTGDASSSGSNINTKSVETNVQIKTVLKPEFQELEDEILNNNIFWKLSYMEHTIESIARKLPGYQNAFIYGTSGVGKTYTVKQIFDRERPDYVYMKGGATGYTGVMKMLYDNRENKLLVLDDFDNMLADRNQLIFNIFKAALENSDEPRVITLIRTGR